MAKNLVDLGLWKPSNSDIVRTITPKPTERRGKISTTSKILCPRSRAQSLKMYNHCASCSGSLACGKLPGSPISKRIHQRELWNQSKRCKSISFELDQRSYGCHGMRRQYFSLAPTPLYLPYPAFATEGPMIYFVMFLWAVRASLHPFHPLLEQA